MSESDVPRRVVTGHDADGKSVFLSDGPTPAVRRRGESAFYELWNTNAMPAPITAAEAAEPTDREVVIEPRAGGTVIRVCSFPPGARSPMHRTETVDYGIVLEGELHLVLDDSETLLSAGDVVVQRGTDHAWDNRGERTARMVFILIDGDFDESLRSLLG